MSLVRKDTSFHHSVLMLAVFMTGPEERRGRKGLFEVIQMAPLPQDVAATGDLWLAHKGKRRVGGVITSRG
jgi:hypothetical protein